MFAACNVDVSSTCLYFNIPYLTYGYHYQIVTLKNDIVKLFDSIEKYGMCSSAFFPLKVSVFR